MVSLQVNKLFFIKINFDFHTESTKMIQNIYRSDPSLLYIKFELNKLLLIYLFHFK